jgi:hypothetical protein
MEPPKFNQFSGGADPLGNPIEGKPGHIRGNQSNQKQETNHFHLAAFITAPTAAAVTAAAASAPPSVA